MANMLTTKELKLIGDLLTLEEMAIKKVGLYSRTLTDPTLIQNFTHLKENHQKRYENLLSLLHVN